jgi:hypothetical protein
MWHIAVALIALLSVSLMTQNVSHAQDDEEFCPSPYESYWETDFCTSNVDYSEIRSGGVARDQIPPIDAPNFETVADAGEWLHDQSPIIALEINGEAKAYPLAVMTWHEIVNDELGGEKITVTFCPLCNSAIVFDRVVDGAELTFGVSGKLRNSDLVMWDRQTESWWQQFTGTGIVGFYTDTQLDFFPSQMISFGEFANRFPDAAVLSRDTGATRNYGANPYARYDSAPIPFLFGGDVDSRLPAMERVLAGIIGREPVAYPFSVISEERVVNDTVGGAEVVVFWQPGKTSALDDSIIDNSRDVGMASAFNRVFNGVSYTFSVDDDGVIRDDQTGSEWNIFGEAVSGEMEGSRLELEVAAPHFWFAWAAFQPETILYGVE